LDYSAVGGLGFVAYSERETPSGESEVVAVGGWQGVGWNTIESGSEPGAGASPFYHFEQPEGG